MTAEIGTVVGIDREAGIVHAFLASGAAVDAYFMGEPPWPLSTAMFDGAPEYVCLGPLGFRRTIFHDDFMWLNAADFAPDLIGDTLWVSGGTGSPAAPNDPSDAAGVLRLQPTTSGNAFYVNKRGRQVHLNPDRVYHLTARIRLNDASLEVRVGLASSNVVTMTGFVPAASDAGVQALLSVDPVFTQYTSLSTFAGITQTTELTGETSPEDTWVWVDLMIAGGQWAAMWTDGSGPWSITNGTLVPTTSLQAVTPFVEAFSVLGAVTADVDCLTLAMVGPCNSPVDLGLGQVPPDDL